MIYVAYSNGAVTQIYKSKMVKKRVNYAGCLLYIWIEFLVDRFTRTVHFRFKISHNINVAFNYKQKRFYQPKRNLNKQEDGRIRILVY